MRRKVLASAVVLAGLLGTAGVTVQNAMASERHFILITTFGKPIWIMDADLFDAAGKNLYHWHYHGNGNKKTWWWTWNGAPNEHIFIQSFNNSWHQDIPANSNFCIKLDQFGYAIGSQTGSAGCTPS